MQISADKDRELQPGKFQKFRDIAQNYNYLRQNRVSYWQSIAIVFGTSSILLLIDLLVGEDIYWKITFIILLFVACHFAYKKSISQTQKQIFVADNLVGTIERGPVAIKEKDGREYNIFSMSDVVPHNSKKEPTQ